MPTTLTILLADDHGLFRDSMAAWLSQRLPGAAFRFASDLGGTIRQLDESVSLVMVDLDMPGMNGAASIVRLRRLGRSTPLLVVSANNDRATVEACLEAGADGYLTKSSESGEILKAVKAVLAGHSYRPRDAAGPGDPLVEHLSRRQIELLGLLAEGLSNRQIAERMHLSEGTVKQYVSQLLQILDVDNRTQAGNKARRLLGLG